MKKKTLLLLTLSLGFTSNSIFADGHGPFNKRVHILENKDSIDSALKACDTIEEDYIDGCAILLKQGTYKAPSRGVDYSTEIMGLGHMPDNVTIDGGIAIGNTSAADTRTFWRALENLTISGNEYWNVSQAAPLRRVNITGNLYLSKGGHYTSGGFMADSHISGNVDGGTQQQWFARNSTWGKNWTHDGMNSTLVNTTGDTIKRNAHQYKTTSKIAEKPHIIWENNQLNVVVPSERDGKIGTEWLDTNAKIIPLNEDNFYIINDQSDIEKLKNTKDHITINKDDSKKGIIFSPNANPDPDPKIANYKLQMTIQKSDFIVLGLGYPKIQPAHVDYPVITTQANGIRIAGLILEDDGHLNSPLLHMDKSKTSTTKNSYLYDIFVKLTSKNTANKNPAILIEQDSVIGDDLWIWAKDNQGAQVAVANKGLKVTGNNVTMYGLAVEHFFDKQTEWLGNSGKVYFYQSELPYDHQGGGPKIPSSFVIDGAKSFKGYGMGVYSVVGDDYTDSGISVIGSSSDVQLQNVYAWNLIESSGVRHVVNDKEACAGGNNACYIPNFSLSVECEKPTVDDKISKTGEVTLSWNKVNQAISYDVKNWNNEPIESNIKGNSFTDTSTKNKHEDLVYYVVANCPNGQKSEPAEVDIAKSQTKLHF
ncbi:hypothetical protein CF386_10165 [Paraphotobacterium marinum]|uniref:Uncharacterized protein n=1 Tax=Paraphotobacterium marinum TaxID=1755811 RepID=A0A220VGC2_9GAMM|nr:hypothetical protein [Paraphotobacterium marinum]ASK79415.1 hypothetical protein CF386_10165 [Paraphotobacterium marinum]